jgi:hypothetical protein
MSACYYLDASALVKRYALETGSAWIIELTDPGTDTADDDLITAARSVGLAVDNPLEHNNWGSQV